jgi:hypothetical protein
MASAWMSLDAEKCVPEAGFDVGGRGLGQRNSWTATLRGLRELFTAF